jgi:hypothetical protein
MKLKWLSSGKDLNYPKVVDFEWKTRRKMTSPTNKAKQRRFYMAQPYIEAAVDEKPTHVNKRRNSRNHNNLSYWF